VARREGTFDVGFSRLVEGMPQGKALDLLQVADRGLRCPVTGANDYGPTAGVRFVIVTAGIARKPGMSPGRFARQHGDRQSGR